MQNNILQPLQYQGEQLYIEYINGEPYFSAKQICKILKHSNYRSAIKTYCFPEGVTVAYTLTAGGKQKATLINEGNLYALIAGCRTLPEAEEFRKWIFNKVLPDIRKNGYFSLIDNKRPLNEYTKREVQIQKSKEINALQFALGGVEAIKEYNRLNCEQVTGMTTKQVKGIGERVGLKTQQRQSAKETCRNIPELQAKACVMALNDDMVKQNPNIKLSQLKNLDKHAEKTFECLLELGIKPAELNQ